MHEEVDIHTEEIIEEEIMAIEAGVSQEFTKSSAFDTIQSVFDTNPSAFETNPTTFETNPSAFETNPSAFETNSSAFDTVPSAFGTCSFVYDTSSSAFDTNPSELHPDSKCADPIIKCVDTNLHCTCNFSQCHFPTATFAITFYLFKYQVCYLLFTISTLTFSSWYLIVYPYSSLSIYSVHSNSLSFS
ncbi:hypothetical protein U1Q18_027210 [Sarracenia purpurea var. burkii]